MGKLLSTVMAIAILGYLGYRTMYGRAPPPAGTDPDGFATGTPKQRLDNVHSAADRIEQQQQKRADEDLKKAAE